jgi:hypothetical protein
MSFFFGRMKDIFNVEYIQQCKIKFEPPKHKRDIAQCANCQRYGHAKNCHLKPRPIDVQVTTWQTNATEKKNRVMSDVSEIILRITSDVQSTRTSERKHIRLSVWINTLLRHRYVYGSLKVMYMMFLRLWKLWLPRTCSPINSYQCFTQTCRLSPLLLQFSMPLVNVPLKGQYYSHSSQSYSLPKHSIQSHFYNFDLLP